jgi:hypothetical protein
MPNFIILRDAIGNSKIQKQRKRNYKNFKEEKFVQEIISTDFMEAFNDQDDVNILYTKFHEKFIKIIDNNAPYKTLSGKETKQQTKPWITKAILKSLITKNKYYKKFVKSQDDFWYHRYKYYRDMINSLIRKSKKTYYKKFFNNNENDAKKLWSQVNSIINKNNCKKKCEIYLNDNGKIITEQKKVANTFNEYFINVAQNLVKKMDIATTSFQSYLKNPNKDSIYLNKVTTDEVIKLTSKLDITKSEDIYGINPRLVKLAGPYISDILTYIFNRSFQSGIFPNNLKKTKVFPIHKADSKMTTSNYRPISILPIISKILERLMHKRLVNFFEKHDTIYKHQFGFQKHKSTEHAILDIYSKIIKSLEKNENPCCIFLDFAKRLTQ